VVRLALETGVIVLRGMRVSTSHQRQGIGNQLLDAVDKVLGTQECFCIPYEHLLPFYGRIGFQDLDPAAAPGFLADRLREYRARRPERFRLVSRHRV
jgi:predicted N-acetyltransferase YhbS